MDDLSSSSDEMDMELQPVISKVAVNVELHAPVHYAEIANGNIHGDDIDDSKDFTNITSLTERMSGDSRKTAYSKDMVGEKENKVNVTERTSHDLNRVPSKFKQNIRNGESKVSKEVICSFLHKESSVSESEDWRAVERCITSSLKAFAIGFGLRGGLTLFSLLARLNAKSSKRVQLRQRPATEVIGAGLKEALRYGLFLGSFAGTFSTLDEVIAALWGFRRTAKWRSLVAGALAGPSLLLTGRKTQHTSMAIYILLRAAVLAARCGIKSERFGWLCRPLAWNYGDTFLMCLSASQILSSWIMKPESLPASYISFLNKHGGKNRCVVDGIKDLAYGNPISDMEDIIAFHKSNSVDVKNNPNVKIPCTIIHGDQHCTSHFFWFLSQAYLRSLPVYIPVYLIPAIIVHRQALLSRPLPILLKTALGTARSSLFLATYCASAWLWTCGIFHVIGKCNPLLVVIATFPAGLSILIEKKSRRMEIALYCFARALESFGICVSDWGLLPWNKKTNPLKRIDVIIFSFATAIIMHCYAQEREVFRSKYLNVLDWVFGIPHDGPVIMKPLVKVSSVPYLLGYIQGR